MLMTPGRTMKRPLSSFVKDTGGNFAVILAVAIIPVVLVVGATVDYSHISQARGKMQNAADSAALAAAIEATSDKKERKKIARKAFRSNFDDFSPDKIKVAVSGESVTVTAIKELKTSFMGLAGYSSVPIEVSSTANIAGDKVEVALVLDVSGSMRAMMSSGRTRLEELKRAAGKLITEVKDVAGEKASFTIIPFTMNVNIGRKNTSWVWGNDKPYFNGTEWMGCVQERKPPFHIANEPGAKLHAYVWPPSPNKKSGRNQCKNPSDGTNQGYASLQEISAGTSFSAQFDGPNRNCVRHDIMPLEADQTKLEGKLASLTAEGNDGTIIAPGVTWGLRALSPEWPMEEGASWKDGVYKYMIVLTDGSQTTEIEYQDQSCNRKTNTKDEYLLNPDDFDMAGDKIIKYGPVDNWTPYGFIADSDPFNDGTNSVSDLPASIDRLSIAACTEAKKARSGNQIEIFTIGVSSATAPGSRTYNLLNKCASKPENHFFAEDSQALNRAFDEITQKVKNIRLTH